MTVGKKFNELNLEEYIYIIDHHKNYNDLNTLGLYRSLVENDKLSIKDKIVVREHAHKFFKKRFDFLQLKDPHTFVKVSSLGMDLTKADERKMWDDVKRNQQDILNNKRIKHRNFGTYSKHDCAYEDCIYRGLMVRPDSKLAWGSMHFDSDKNRYAQKLSSDRQKADRKKRQVIISQQLEDM